MTRKVGRQKRQEEVTQPRSVVEKNNLKQMALIGGCVLAPVFLSAILLWGLSQGSPPVLSEGVQNWRDSGFAFNFRNISVFYKDIFALRGYQKKPVLLILHGFPTSSYDYKKVVFHLLSSFGRIIAPDFIGFGFSDKMDNHTYTIFEQATMCEELLNQLGVSKVHILAHDIGDTVAQEMLARFEERKEQNTTGLIIESLCLSNGGILPEVNKPRFIQKVLLTKWIGDIVSSLVTHSIFKKSFSEVFADKYKPTEEELRDFWSILCWNNGYRIGARLIKYIPERFANRDRWVGSLQNTTVPLHLIYGKEDPVNPTEALAAYQRLIPQSTVYVIDDVGHYPHWEHPERFLRGYFTFAVRLRLPRY